MPERLTWLLQIVWLGNMAAMARDLHVSQPTLFRIFDRGGVPSRRVLSTMCASPNINGGWLKTGIGKPIPGITYTTQLSDDERVQALLQAGNDFFNACTKLVTCIHDRLEKESS